MPITIFPCPDDTNELLTELGTMVCVVCVLENELCDVEVKEDVVVFPLVKVERAMY